MNRQLEQSQIEKILKNIVNTTHHANTADKVQLEALVNEKQSLASKLDRKKSEYERLKQRLDTLQKIRYWSSSEFVMPVFKLCEFLSPSHSGLPSPRNSKIVRRN